MRACQLTAPACLSSHTCEEGALCVLCYAVENSRSISLLCLCTARREGLRIRWRDSYTRAVVVIRQMCCNALQGGAAGGHRGAPDFKNSYPCCMWSPNLNVSLLLHCLSCREGLLAAIEEHQILILVAETGAGKTTQVRQQPHAARNHKSSIQAFMHEIALREQSIGGHSLPLLLLACLQLRLTNDD